MVIIKVVALQGKKLMEIIGSIFVALIFLSSYAAFGGGAVSPNTTTTVLPSQTYYASARGTAAITSYAPVLNINISCSNITSVSAKLNSALVSLERNGSVSNFYSQQAAQILVQAGSIASNQIYGLLLSRIGAGSACTSFASSANVHLPSRMNFYVPSQKTSVLILIPGGLQSASVPVKFAQNMSGAVNVSVSVLLTINGAIYGNLSVRQV